MKKIIDFCEYLLRVKSNHTNIFTKISETGLIVDKSSVENLRKDLSNLGINPDDYKKEISVAVKNNFKI